MHRKRPEIFRFPVVSGADYWTRTSDLMRVNGSQKIFLTISAVFNCYLSLSATFVSRIFHLFHKRLWNVLWSTQHVTQGLLKLPFWPVILSLHVEQCRYREVGMRIFCAAVVNKRGAQRRLPVSTISACLMYAALQAQLPSCCGHWQEARSYTLGNRANGVSGSYRCEPLFSSFLRKSDRV